MLGFHVSISGSIDLAVDRALEIGCTTFQIFTRNPRGWGFKPLDPQGAALFRQKRRKAGYKKIASHMPYLPNLAAPIKPFQARSRASLREELARCSALDVDYLVAHIGSHMGAGAAAGVRNVISGCDEALAAVPCDTILCLETMAGQQNSVGSKFEELKMIFDGVKEPERMGVCIDTCHLFSSGSDISTRNGVQRTMGLFADTVGYERLKVIHLNDSKGSLGSGLDRHEHIGMGQIGSAGLRAFLDYRRNSRLPILMETPIDDRRRDEDNMRLVRRWLTGKKKTWAPPPCAPGQQRPSAAP